MSLAAIFVYALYAYLLVGLVFALWFVAKGVDKLDEVMHESNWKVRLLLVPGSALLWPVLLRKLLSKTSIQSEIK
jgi:hypothetical protein